MTGEVHLLWTGGWDSTYRLLEILSLSSLNIRPHYIVDPERVSWEREIEAMEFVRTAMGKRAPDWAERIKATCVTRREEIAPDAEIEGAFEEIRGRGHIGQQYCWLARYAKMSDLYGLELCIESSDAAGRHIRENVRPVRASDPAQYELAPMGSRRDSPVEILFHWFQFPLIYREKKEMEEAIDRLDAWPIMAKTWFCHQPVLSRYACGTCRPCVYVFNKGQAWRIDLIGQIRFNCIERPRRLLPAGMKRSLRRHVGERVKRFIRA